MAGATDAVQIDEAYEFMAPKFFDFMNEESTEDVRRAERWFETSLSYAPSPFMPKIKVGRSVQIDSVCDFGHGEQTLKEQESVPESSCQRNDQQELVDMVVKDQVQKEVKDGKISFEFAPETEHCSSSDLVDKENSTLVSNSTSAVDTRCKEATTFTFPVLSSSTVASIPAATEACTPDVPAVPGKRSVPSCSKSRKPSEACTPKPQRVLMKGAIALTNSKNQSAKTMASVTRQPSALKPKESPSIAQENQAIKRQKLDGGKSRQILNVKTRLLPHKSKAGLVLGTDIFGSSVKSRREDTLACKEGTTFISAAEMVQRFQSRTRDIEFSQNRPVAHESTASVIQRRPKLTLTRPKEPEFETSQRVRAVRVKSSAELEEEMLAKMPKFKARPFNKKIFEAPTLPALPRSAPHPPEFHEFHLKTMERANQHAETSSVVSSLDVSKQNQGKPCKLTEPKPPLLETSLRVRPPRVKSSKELELEELEKIPKFKARPLNKKIFESKGDLGLFCNSKPPVTTPHEFHFATNERLGPPQAAVMDLFDKLSLHSETSAHHSQHEVPKLTIPNPFHLHTEERGMEKERQFSMQVLQKQLEEDRARIPRANPYPYTTDYPVIPPKSEPKQCTKPEAFQLESLVRHEEEMQRKLEEKERMEKEEAQRRLFRARPVLKEDPIPLPEKERKPLTDVQEFALHVDHRAAERSEFDKKIKEKELVYKRLREENETTKMVEEEKAIKQMRRTMVPHARPLPKFDNPFHPQKSTKEITKPKSPLLLVKLREERRHHMR